MILQKYNVFTERIIEAGAIITVSEFKDMFKNELYDFYLTNIQLYRGVQSDAEIIYYAPGSNKRKSIDIKNFYTLLTSNLPAWSEYPRRSNAIIMTTSKNYANEYTEKDGNIYRVIPSDNALMAISPTFDIYTAYTKYFKRWEVTDFPEFIEGISEAYEEMTGKKLNDTTWASFSKQVKIFDNIKKLISDVIEASLSLAPFFLEFVEQIKYKTWLEWMNFMFDPTKTGFKLYHYNKGFNVQVKGVKGLEIWTEDECWLVRDDIFKNLQNKGLFPNK